MPFHPNASELLAMLCPTRLPLTHQTANQIVYCSRPCFLSLLLKYSFIQVTELSSLKLNCCCSKVPQNLVTIHPFLTYLSSIQVESSRVFIIKHD